LALATVIAFAVALRVGREAEGSDNVIDDPPRQTF
jgi:hypothetical protein